MVAVVSELLEPYWKQLPPDGVWREFTERVRALLTLENKRKNLVGEGFEDVLREIVSRVHGERQLLCSTRVRIGDVAGFYSPQHGKKEKKVDLLITDDRGHRTLVTAKWSIRADREEQFLTDFNEYDKLENSGNAWSYVLVTNEFDPARLVAACDVKRAGNQSLFTRVVHVNPNGVVAAYGNDPQRSAEVIAEHVRTGRLISLSHWLASLCA